MAADRVQQGCLVAVGLPDPNSHAKCLCGNMPWYSTDGGAALANCRHLAMRWACGQSQPDCGHLPCPSTFWSFICWAMYHPHRSWASSRVASSIGGELWHLICHLSPALFPQDSSSKGCEEHCQLAWACSLQGCFICGTHSPLKLSETSVFCSKTGALHQRRCVSTFWSSNDGLASPGRADCSYCLLLHWILCWPPQEPHQEKFITYMKQSEA